MKRLLFAAMVGAATPSIAQNSATLERRGHWTAFVARSEAGRISCGVDVIDPNDGRHFMLKWFQGDSEIFVHVHNPRWNVPVGRSVAVRLRVDGYGDWTATAAMAATNTVEWRISQETLGRFEAQFRVGNQMTIHFPNGTERPWVISLWGSNAIMTPWLECMRSAGPLPQGRPT